jgi:hypothetical protein
MTKFDDTKLAMAVPLLTQFGMNFCHNSRAFKIHTPICSHINGRQKWWIVEFCAKKTYLFGIFAHELSRQKVS